MSDPYPSPANRLLILEQDLRETQRAIEAIRRERQPQFVFPQQPKLAITCDPATGSYPTFNANVFPIKFLDADFTATTGQRTLNKTNRQEDAATVALFPSGNWIPKDTVLPVFQCRGLGDEDAGDWFFADGPREYFGKLTGDLESGGTGSANVHEGNVSLGDVLATLDVQAGPLVGSGVTILEDTWVHFVWDEVVDAFVIDAAACAVEA